MSHSLFFQVEVVNKALYWSKTGSITLNNIVEVAELQEVLFALDVRVDATHNILWKHFQGMCKRCRRKFSSAHELRVHKRRCQAPPVSATRTRVVRTDTGKMATPIPKVFPAAKKLYPYCETCSGGTLTHPDLVAKHFVNAHVKSEVEVLFDSGQGICAICGLAGSKEDILNHVASEHVEMVAELAPKDLRFIFSASMKTPFEGWDPSEAEKSEINEQFVGLKRNGLKRHTLVLKDIYPRCVVCVRGLLHNPIHLRQHLAAVHLRSKILAIHGTGDSCDLCGSLATSVLGAVRHVVWQHRDKVAKVIPREVHQFFNPKDVSQNCCGDGLALLKIIHPYCAKCQARKGKFFTMRQLRRHVCVHFFDKVFRLFGGTNTCQLCGDLTAQEQVTKRIVVDHMVDAHRVEISEVIPTALVHLFLVHTTFAAPKVTSHSLISEQLGAAVKKSTGSDSLTDSWRTKSTGKEFINLEQSNGMVVVEEAITTVSKQMTDPLTMEPETDPLALGQKSTIDQERMSTVKTLGELWPSCLSCVKGSFKYPTVLWVHLASHYSEEAIVLCGEKQSCTVCPKTFVPGTVPSEKKYDICSHVGTAHKDLLSQVVPSSVLDAINEMFDKETIKKRGRSNRRYLVTNEECEDCRDGFTTLNNLKLHLSSRHYLEQLVSDYSSGFICSLCEEDFSLPAGFQKEEGQTLTLHRLSQHIGVKHDKIFAVASPAILNELEELESTMTNMNTLAKVARNRERGTRNTSKVISHNSNVDVMAQVSTTAAEHTVDNLAIEETRREGRKTLGDLHASCFVCVKSNFQSPYNLWTHLAVAHFPEEAKGLFGEELSCAVCPKTLVHVETPGDRRSAIGCHVGNVHRDLFCQVVPPEINEAVDAVFDKAEIERRRELGRNKQWCILDESDEWDCETCRDGFGTLNSLKLHLASDHYLEELLSRHSSGFVCNLCGQDFYLPSCFDHTELQTMALQRLAQHVGVKHNQVNAVASPVVLPKLLALESLVNGNGVKSSSAKKHSAARKVSKSKVVSTVKKQKTSKKSSKRFSKTKAVCNVCSNGIFQRRSALWEHFALMHNHHAVLAVFGMTNTCNICGIVCGRKQKVTRHVLAAHMDLYRQKLPSQLLEKLDGWQGSWQRLPMISDNENKDRGDSPDAYVKSEDFVEDNATLDQDKQESPEACDKSEIFVEDDANLDKDRQESPDACDANDVLVDVGGTEELVSDINC